MEDILTPEQYQQLLDLGMLNAEMDPAIAQQEKMIEELRAGSTAPQGGMVGNHFVAPAASQYIAALGNKYAAGKLNQDALAQQKMKADNVRRQNQMVMGAIVGKPGVVLQAPQPATPPPVDPYAALRTGGTI